MSGGNSAGHCSKHGVYRCSECGRNPETYHTERQAEEEQPAECELHSYYWPLGGQCPWCKVAELEQQIPRWIPVSEDKPKPGKRIWAYYEYSDGVAFVGKEMVGPRGYINPAITYWQYEQRPAPPQQGEQKGE